MRFLVLCLIAAAVTACSGTMKPTQSEGDRYRFHYFQVNYERALAGANAQCARQGKAAKLDRAECITVDRMQEPSCAAEATCEYCDAWFVCTDKPQKDQGGYSPGY